MMIKVIHIIPSLEVGGAEKQLSQLVLGNREKGVINQIVSLKPIDTEISNEIISKGNRIDFFDFSGFKSVKEFIRLVRFLYTTVDESTVVVSWMYHASLISFLALLLIGRQQCSIWNIRRTSIPGGTSFYVCKILAIISSVFSVNIVSCAVAAKRTHKLFGFSDKSFSIINNGVDTKKFLTINSVREKVRTELGIVQDEFLIGTVGRLNPSKGYNVLLMAIAELNESNRLPEKTRFVLIGRGLTTCNYVRDFLKNNEIDGLVFLVDETKDVASYYSAMDAYCMPSLTEGFPNSLLEALSHDLYPIATDTGDTSLILPGLGTLIQPNNISALSQAIIKLEAEKELVLKGEIRDHIVDVYSIDSMIGSYHAMYEEIIGNK